MAKDLSRTSKIDDIGQIFKMLEQLEESLRERNRQGLYDLSRKSEDIICTLLNLAFDWKLVNLNETRSNCPVIDLADQDRGIGVQVTSAKRENRSKEDIITLLKKHHQIMYYRVLIFHIIENSHKAEKKDGIVEYWDMSDLKAAIMGCSAKTQSQILEFLYKVKDEGIFDENRSLLSVDNYFVSGQNMDEDYVSGCASFTCQRGRVRITAFVPRSPSEEICCYIEFARRDTIGHHITFDSKTITEMLFVGHHQPMEERGYTVATKREDGLALLQLGNSRMIVDINTAEQFGEVIDSLYEEYECSQRRLADILGTTGFSLPPDESWAQPIMRIPVWLWRCIREFVQEHDAFTRHNEWDVFNSAVPPSTVRIVRNKGEKSISGILAELFASVNGEVCTVLWKRGYDGDSRECVGFDNQTKWRADYTANWFLTQLLPHICEIIYQQQFIGMKNRIRNIFSNVPKQDDFVKSILSRITSFYLHT